MNNNTEKKIKRQTIPLETKLLILKRLADGKGPTAVANEFKVRESTIRSISKRANKIYESLDSVTNDSSKRAIYSRNIVIEKTEKALMLWIKDSTDKGNHVKNESIREKAIQYFNQVKDSESSSCLRDLKFSASKGWLAGFLKRYALHGEKIEGEAASDEAALNNSEELTDNIGDGYSDQVYSGENHLNEMIENQTFKNEDQTFEDEDQTFEDEDQTFNSDILNSLIKYENDQEEPESLTAHAIYAGIQISDKLETHFLQIDTNAERRLQFQNELRLCMSRYREVYHQLNGRPSSQKLITDYYCVVPKTEPNNEGDLESIDSKIGVLNYNNY